MSLVLTVTINYLGWISIILIISVALLYTFLFNFIIYF